tara:strand:+ start:3839 stop:5575 length:1737 start_codon:yes stop_codon:yes gene_type:complete
MGLLLLQGSAALNPRELFANNEQGLWLDPSDFPTMWQDAAGDTPVTAASDPVALILDKSRSGPSMGSNQVTNGGFGADSDWTKGTGWTIGSGVATKTAGSASLLSQAQTMTAGRYYIVTYTITRTAGSITPQFAGGSTVSGTARSTSGTFTDIMTVVSGNNTLQLSADASFAGTVDNVSLKELSAGNHAFQTTSASRPTLARIPSSGRRNLLTYSEQFDNAAWTKTGVTVSANQTANPANGLTDADLLTEDSGLTNHGISQTYTATAAAHTVSVYAKFGSHSHIEISLDQSSSDAYAVFDIQNGTVANQGVGATGIATALASGWYRFSVTFTMTAGSKTARIRLGASSTVFFYTGNGTRNTTLWGAQLETGSTATNYQKVAATTDVTESGVSDLWHLVFDGSDDSLTTNSVDMTGTAQMTVIAGVRKLSDAASGMVAELSATASSNAGSFNFLSPRANGEASFAFTLNGGSALNLRSYTGLAAPRTDVISATLDTTAADSAAAIAVRLNGASTTGTEVVTAASTGNFGNHVLNIGRRNQATIPFNGHIYQLIIRGKTTPTGKLLEAERFVARKTGVSI